MRFSSNICPGEGKNGKDDKGHVHDFVGRSSEVVEGGNGL